MEMSLAEFLQKVSGHEGSKYIYGAGNIGGLLQKECRKSDIKIEGFVVSDTTQNQKEKDGLPVYGIDEINKDEQRDVLFIIGVMERGEKKIEEELLKRGFFNILTFPMEIMEKDTFYEYRKSSPVIEITPKIGCSVNCRYCPQNVLLSNYFSNDKCRKSSMSFADFKSYIKKLPSNCIIDFSGFVEPFLNPEAIYMMEYADSLGRDMTLFTTLEGADKYTIQRLIKLNFTLVVLHVADKDRYANIEVNSNYLELVEMILAGKKKDGRPFVDTANCQSRPHPEVVKIADGKIKIYCVMQDRAGNLESENNTLIGADIQGKICCDRAYNTDHFVLLPDGTVVLCCNDYGMKHVLGNLNFQSYEDIINGGEMTRIKESMLLANNHPIICRKCMYAKEL